MLSLERAFHFPFFSLPLSFFTPALRFSDVDDVDDVDDDYDVYDDYDVDDDDDDDDRDEFLPPSSSA